MIEDDNADVWFINQTEEIFTSYEEYLQRMDFYKQRRFICEITGHSGLTFFEALKSEMDGSKDVDRSFPEALKEPVLRKIQFSTISRIDSLVDYVFDEFKQDFYPGENVTVSVGNGTRLNGIVREKTRFAEIRSPDGNIERRGFSRYFVALTNRPQQEALVDDEHIVRDRKSFTKQILRSFIKNTVTREAWTGAPWLVKEYLAKKLRIETEVPPHLKQESKLAEKKAQLAHKKGDHDVALPNLVSPQSRLPELKPATKSHKSKHVQQQQLAKTKQQQFLEYQQALSGQHNHQQSLPSHINGQAQFIHSNFHGFAPIAAKGAPQAFPQLPVKYPIEDLEVPPAHDGVHRPSLQFLSQDTPKGDRGTAGNGILMASVGPMLETWDTLNVYCEEFILDSFTFDDFVQALQFSSEDVDCDLFVEIHCAVLKILVEEDSKGGKIRVNLPDMPEDDESDEEESTGDERSSASLSPPPQPKTGGRATRSSLAQSEIPETNGVTHSSRSTTAEAKTHRATEMLAEYAWVDRLRKRDFQNGGWETIMVGLLYQLSLKMQYENTCEEILAVLAPIDQPPTQETARQQYAGLDVNLRIKALQIICLLTVETKTVRGYIEECNEEMTNIRKEKIEWQRNRKTLVEDLRLLDEERRVLQSALAPQSSEPEAETNGDIEMTGTNGKVASPIRQISEEEEEEEEGEAEAPPKGRSLRRGDDRASERKRKREEEQDKRLKAESTVKLSKEAKILKRVVNQIEEKKVKIKECEDEIASLDEDLRQSDCPRTRCLGKDRFWNRYWWFERNGMPYAGLPNSSTADAAYANGCLWVQGPDDLEREGFIDLQGDDERRYIKAFQMTVSERKKLEEGSTSLFTARQWGFYEEPDSVDMLIGWLDVRGNRELKLRKELQAQRENIMTHMRNRGEYLTRNEKKSSEEPMTRMSTRTKTYVDHTSHRCLAWRNTTALEEIGHLHSEQARPKKARKTEAKADVGRVTRGVARNRQGKQLKRQGTRYNF
ncbi:MAG: hypothetical protein M1833_002969 [Piccolia ochrophora]|nr:MAG: hypothetical protein M1833_002969 [Piccolia ochrophora]